MEQYTSRGCSPLSPSAPRPRRPAEPGARFWTKTSDLATRRRRISLASPCLRSKASDSLERLSQTKWLDMPLTVSSYPLAKSPTPGRSTFMTLAPRSASWRVAKGAATACSRETTVTPSRGRFAALIISTRQNQACTSSKLFRCSWTLPAALRRMLRSGKGCLGYDLIALLFPSFYIILSVSDRDVSSVEKG